MRAIAEESLSTAGRTKICDNFQDSGVKNAVCGVQPDVKGLTAGILSLSLLTAASINPVQQKFDNIEQGRVPHGARLLLSPSDLNLWARQEAAYWAPQGVRDLRLDLSEGRATGFARIDFVKLKQASDGAASSYLFRRLFSGERPVSVTARFESRDGQARVDVERVEISGVPIEGPGLDFLIQTYLWATFPDARTGEWFPLDKHVDHFAVHPTGVAIVVR